MMHYVNKYAFGAGFLLLTISISYYLIFTLPDKENLGVPIQNKKECWESGSEVHDGYRKSLGIGEEIKNHQFKYLHSEQKCLYLVSAKVDSDTFNTENKSIIHSIRNVYTSDTMSYYIETTEGEVVEGDKERYIDDKNKYFNTQ